MINLSSTKNYLRYSNAYKCINQKFQGPITFETVQSIINQLTLFPNREMLSMPASIKINFINNKLNE